jgi:hypothetical protein
VHLLALTSVTGCTGFQWAGLPDMVMGSLRANIGPGHRMIIGISIDDATEYAKGQGLEVDVAKVWKSLLRCTYSEFTTMDSAFVLSLGAGEAMILPPGFLLAEHAVGLSTVLLAGVLHEAHEAFWTQAMLQKAGLASVAE